MKWKTIYRKRNARYLDYGQLFPSRLSHKYRKVMFNYSGGHVYVAKILDQSRILNIFKVEDMMRKSGRINYEQQMD